MGGNGLGRIAASIRDWIGGAAVRAVDR